MRPLKSLLISPTEPRPDGAGIQRRAWSHLEALSEAGEVHLVLLLLDDQVARLSDPDQLRARCKSLTILRIAKRGRLRKIKTPGLTALLRLLTIGRPRYRVDGTGSQTGAHTEPASSYDLMFCFRLKAFSLLAAVRELLKIPETRVFVDLDDIESIALRRELAATGRSLGIEQRILVEIEKFEAIAGERRAMRLATGIAVCSAVDRDRLASNASRTAIVVIPNSFPRVTPLPLSKDGPGGRILFLGTMTYKPNEDAALFFCKEVFPLICARIKHPVTFEIVGRGPSASVRALAGDSRVVVTGGVECVEPYYERCKLVVAPIRFGGGTRIKILEALALGRPVVATSIGADGLALEPNREILIADGAPDFASACVALLSSADLRTTIAGAGRAAYLRSYEAKAVQRTMTDTIRSLLVAQV